MVLTPNGQIFFLILFVVYVAVKKLYLKNDHSRFGKFINCGVTTLFSLLILRPYLLPLLTDALSWCLDAAALVLIPLVIGTPLFMDSTWSPIPSMDSPNLEPLPVGDTSGNAVPAPANPPTDWLSERVQLWCQTAHLSPTPDWAKGNIENHGGYAQVFGCSDWRIIAEPTGRPLKPENIFVVFRNGGFCEASVFIASNIPDEGDASNHLTWPKRTLRVSTIFDGMVREYERRRLDEMLQRYPYPPHQ